MASAPRPTVLIDVTPSVLQGALVVLLNDLGVDDVVIDLTKSPPVVDAVVMSAELPTPTVVASIVITLPREGSDPPAGTIAVAGEEASVRIASIYDLLMLLDLRCPGATPRVSSSLPGGP